MLRRALLVSVLIVAALPTSVPAQLPEPPELPVPVPQLPVPAAAPLPAAPLPAAPDTTATAPAVSETVNATTTTTTTAAATTTPAAAPAAATGTDGTGTATAASSSSPPTSLAGGSGRASATGGAKAQRARRTAAVRRTVVLPFRAASAGPVEIELMQVAPLCREAGRVVVRARAGANRFRFDGRVDGRRLRDGTYAATTPSGTVRFAVVRGRPTRRGAGAESVCRSKALVAAGASRAAPVRSAAEADGAAAGARLESDPTARSAAAVLPRVLGASVSEAIEAAASLNPIFYVLLALAIAALATASLPARALPAPTVGALLARRRAELTLIGTLVLLTVIVAYWHTFVA